MAGKGKSMQTLVLSRSSLSVHLEGNHLLIHDHARPDGPVTKVPLATIGRVVVSGQPAISFPVLARLMDLEIPCSFMTSGGRWRGLMDGDRGFHADRRMRQYESLANEDFCRSFTRRVISAKIKNCRRTIQRLAASRNEAIDQSPDWKGLTCNLAELSRFETVDSIRGLEGVAAARYFRLLARFFPKDAPFLERTRRPPRDAANALLSFAYTLLENEVVASVRSHGLDVAAGYFHRDHGRSPSLALDLMEPFRPVLADRLVLDLLNHRRIHPQRHFETVENGGVHLTEEGRPIVFRAFDEALLRQQETPYGRLSLRQMIDRDVCSYLAFLEKGMLPTFYLAA